MDKDVKTNTTSVTSSDSHNYYNKKSIESQVSSSKSTSSKNTFTFKVLWASIIVLTLLQSCSFMQFTYASPLPNSHLSLNPSTSLPRRAVTRKFPIYPIPASSSIVGSTVSVSQQPPLRKSYTSGNYFLSRMGSNLQGFDSSSRYVRIPSSPMSKFKANTVFNQGIRLERLTENVPIVRQGYVDRSITDRSKTNDERRSLAQKENTHHKSERSAVSEPLEGRNRRELEELPMKSNNEYYEEYDEEASPRQSNNEKTIEELPSKKESLLNELHDTKEKWVNPCGINFGSVNKLNRITPDYVYEPLTDNEILQKITITVSKALRQSRRFKEDYVSTFNITIITTQLGT